MRDQTASNARPMSFGMNHGNKKCAVINARPCVCEYSNSYTKSIGNPFRQCDRPYPSRAYQNHTARNSPSCFALLRFHNRTCCNSTVCSPSGFLQTPSLLLRGWMPERGSGGECPHSDPVLCILADPSLPLHRSLCRWGQTASPTTYGRRSTHQKTRGSWDWEVPRLQKKSGGNLINEHPSQRS